jgi:hypothetical protein
LNSGNDIARMKNRQGTGHLIANGREPKLADLPAGYQAAGGAGETNLRRIQSIKAAVATRAHVAGSGTAWPLSP